MNNNMTALHEADLEKVNGGLAVGVTVGICMITIRLLGFAADLIERHA